jgi:tRNA G18 (ribose-2'-O)-methylase SpoU
VPFYVAPSEIVNGVIGFKFHSGVIAVGHRPASVSLNDLLEPPELPRTFLVCPELANTENLGGLIRIAAAFGVDAVILGERSCDPFFRQSVRVSMGSVFKLPIVQSTNIIEDLHLMRSRGVELIASVLEESAESLSTVKRAPRIAILFGNEAQGLSAEHIALCDRRVTIPMKLGTDSLNVAIAAAVFLYEFTR